MEYYTKERLGLKFSIFDISKLDNILEAILLNNKKTIFFGYSLMYLPKIKHNLEVIKSTINYDFYVIDGKGLYFLFKLLGENIKEHFSLPDLVEYLLKYSNSYGLKLYLLGSTEQNNLLAVKNIKIKYPKIKIVGSHHGYFNEIQEKTIVEDINKCSPNILIIGISTPKKEEFVRRNRESLKVNIIVPCGGMIDVFAGITKREPKLVKFLGMTWFYRFIQEPLRLFKPMLINFFYLIFYLIPVIIFNEYIINKKFNIFIFYEKKCQK